MAGSCRVIAGAGAEDIVGSGDETSSEAGVSADPGDCAGFGDGSGPVTGAAMPGFGPDAPRGGAVVGAGFVDDAGPGDWGEPGAGF